MQENHSRENYDAVIYLMACALNGVVPSVQYFEGKNISEIFGLAVRHSVGALVAHALEKAGMAPQSAIERKNASIRKTLLFDFERAEILKILESEKIKYMPLKGVFTKDLYPSIGLREMGDNDILFDSAYRARVMDIMLERGYEVEQYDRFNHDVYIKQPVFNFEMHVDLFARHEERSFYEYFKNALDRAVVIDGTEYGRQFSDEDNYIYIKLHEYKHYKHGGMGLRILADTYVFLRAKEQTLNFDYINRELKNLGADEYEALTRRLAFTVLSKESAENPPKSLAEVLDRELFNTYEYMCFSGTYGTAQNNMNNAIKEYEKTLGDAKKAKFSYLWRRIFPPMRVYEIYYPFYYKHKILIPFLFVKRVCRALFKNRKREWASFKHIMKYDKNRK